MAKEGILKDNNTGEIIYPVTKVNCVKDDNGNALDPSKISKELFIDLWNEACKWNRGQGTAGQYNPETGYFELHDLTDITYEQAISIYNAGHIDITCESKYADNYLIRTVLPNKGNYNSSYNIQATFRSCTNLEVVVLHYCNLNTETFTNCPKLTRIGTRGRGLFSLNNVANIKLNNPLLEHLYGNLRGNYSFSLEGCPLISLDSFKYMVQYAYNTTPITITVHPDIYAKLTDTENTEWYQVSQDAIAKQITFATIE